MEIAMLHGPFEFFAHERAFREDAGQHENEEDGEPVVSRKAGTEALICRITVGSFRFQYDQFYSPNGRQEGRENRSCRN
jgi:hypothetical protein